MVLAKVKILLSTRARKLLAIIARIIFIIYELVCMLRARKCEDVSLVRMILLLRGGVCIMPYY